jgi:sialic acid synthase SpsE/mannose-6-phosphate isomerase-like protein (cupin superfamily)
MTKRLISNDKNEPLFVFDLANNHQGDLKHARVIINSVNEQVKLAGVKGAMKFQFRNLDTYIHESFTSRDDLKYITRFKSTKLDKTELNELVQFSKSLGFITMTTPFDEESVDFAEEIEVDILKIASACADDFPLIKKIIKKGKPIIASTGGLRVEQIDNLVRLLEKSSNEFGIMHCVSIYPTPDNLLNLNQISLFKERYPNVPIGWSTHENPNNFTPVILATALGASIFERHIGIATERYVLNDYSSTPEQLGFWFQQQKNACNLLGADERPPTTAEESEALSQLKRGIYAKSSIKKGEKLSTSNIKFAFPAEKSQLNPGDTEFGLVATEDIKDGEAIYKEQIEMLEDPDNSLSSILLQARGMLSRSRTALNEDAEVEISHHYGMSRFREFGAILITCVNRDYAKKIVVQLPRQKHPYHYHKKKEETFHLLWGDLEITINGKILKMNPGDIALVKPGEWHKFQTLNGAIIEEISTTSLSDDSVYEDSKIKNVLASERKTKILNWKEFFGFIDGLR